MLYKYDYIIYESKYKCVKCNDFFFINTISNKLFKI